MSTIATIDAYLCNAISAWEEASREFWFFRMNEMYGPEVWLSAYEGAEDMIDSLNARFGTSIMEFFRI